MVEAKQMTIGILGYGEVGKAIYKLYEEKGISPLLRDITRNEFTDLDVLHVCIPYTEHFVSTVWDNQTQYEPSLVVIHSTVPVGTTKKIGTNAVHAPIRGIHPNLKEGIETFVMYVGYDRQKALQKFEAISWKMGIKFSAVKDSRNTELAKLASTTYYGLCIAYHGYVDKLVKKHKLDFDMVMTDWTDTYNDGYTKLGKPEVTRPILYPPKGNIGGHCVIENAKLLEDQYGKDPILDSILRYE